MEIIFQVLSGDMTVVVCDHVAGSQGELTVRAGQQVEVIHVAGGSQV